MTVNKINNKVNLTRSKVEVIVPLLTILSDSIAIMAAFLLSYWIRFISPFKDIVEVVKGVAPLYGYIYFALVMIPVWILIFHNSKMYRLKRNVFVGDQFFVIVKCVTIGIIFAMSMIFFYRDFPYSRIAFAMIWLIAIILITIGRYFTLKFEKSLYNRKIGVSKVAVFGIDETAKRIYEKFSKDTFAGFNVMGYFSYDTYKENMMEGKNLLGDFESVPTVIRRLGIEKLLISLPSSQNELLHDLTRMCEGINVEFMLVPDYIESLTSKLKVEEVDGIPFMKLKSVPMNIWNRFVKRSSDIIFSLIILFFASPVMLVLAALVKLTSKGPLFYKQERVGLDGYKFDMYKFRSMRVDAEKDGPKMTIKNDDRYTTVGKFLRKYSLDELPQFINVLKGDMSIVGPRPEREYFVNILKGSVKKYLERHRVKCGVTGWAQVNGLRGTNTSIQTRIDYDIYYIENWSLAFDIKIIFKTLKEVLFSKEAF